MKICVAGSGAFGTALAIALAAAGKTVTLLGRDADAMEQMTATRENPRLPDRPLPDQLALTASPEVLADADIVLLAMPAQALRSYLDSHSDKLSGKALVACCKGIDMTTLSGPTATIKTAVPTATPAILSGPSFAADIAKGLPTALTIACPDDAVGQTLQTALSTPTLRLYRTTDTTGVELGGALKNVIAIACGVSTGAELGDSARAALMTRGSHEVRQLAERMGADPQTLGGLAGFGDLALTCTSQQSRNYRFGIAIGRNAPFDPSVTVEGASTAKAVRKLAHDLDIDLPICTVVAKLCNQEITVKQALDTLLSRPLKEE
ncbi:glycerol-3-phosphate dehydrogenase (NAD(P)+) [Cognatiyoonia koreensis]|uniref:Glycerol-3-phosphate dehydrogenase [NAD(P)+] n=1 Tax=Cognatiyoonia koreensis TaxID=364200 RepID=A0A1I0RQ49_9RHOB|nr:NAD(P)H-dependent glycerol-3-phosphate dehydrogenase [Cognatiyoonia koreensis]SEW43405.1 glycerol-3-phosphate dehydrogenase (NAD(P)+) [Cognatiyoonia koreensis]